MNKSKLLLNLSFKPRGELVLPKVRIKGVIIDRLVSHAHPSSLLRMAIKKVNGDLIEITSVKPLNRKAMTVPQGFIISLLGDSLFKGCNLEIPASTIDSIYFASLKLSNSNNAHPVYKKLATDMVSFIIDYRRNGSGEGITIIKSYSEVMCGGDIKEILRNLVKNGAAITEHPESTWETPFLVVTDVRDIPDLMEDQLLQI